MKMNEVLRLQRVIDRINDETKIKNVKKAVVRGKQEDQFYWKDQEVQDVQEDLVERNEEDLSEHDQEDLSEHDEDLSEHDEVDLLEHDAERGLMLVKGSK